MSTPSIAVATPAARLEPHPAARLEPHPAPFQPHPAAPFEPVGAATARADDPLGIADPFVVTDPAAGGWISAASLVDGTALPLLLDGPIEKWGAAPHAAAALAWKAYTYWLAVPAVLALTCANRVPLLDADNVLVRLSYDRPFVTIGIRRPAVAVLPDDRYAGQPDAVVVNGTDGLLRALATSLVDRHLAPLADATRARVRIGHRILSGSLASSIGYALQFAQGFTPTADLALGRALLDALRVTGLVDLSECPAGAVEVHRRTCCLAFTVAGMGICSDCCIRS